MRELVPNDRSLAIVIAAQSSWRINSLSAVIAAMPNVTIIGRTQDAAALIACISASYPDLVILDGGMINGDLTSIIGHIKTLSPATACIVIVQYRNQQYATAEAIADAVLLDGFRTEALADLIEQLSHNPKLSSASRGVSR